MKSPEELYEEKCEEAACKLMCRYAGYVEKRGYELEEMQINSFKEGVHWASTHHHPKVQKLVEALEKIRLGSIELAEGYESVPKAKDGHEDPDAYMASCNFRMIEELCEASLADFKKEG